MTGTRRLLITGIGGYLGGRIAQLADGWEVVGTRFTSAGATGDIGLDITDRAAVRSVLQEVRPDVVIHTAAGRERNDWRANADGPANVALAAAEVGARLVHMSTDGLFSGRDVHYDESALPDPVDTYGAAKAAAETAVRAVAEDAVIVRTSLIMGDGRGNHELLTHGLVSGRLRGALFTDEIRKPVHVDDLAQALLELSESDYRGVLNVAGAEALSRYELGMLVAKRDGLDVAALPMGRLAETGLVRPVNVQLDTGLAAGFLHTRLRGGTEFLAGSL